jgi:hypothetical protein
MAGTSPAMTNRDIFQAAQPENNGSLSVGLQDDAWHLLFET